MKCVCWIYDLVISSTKKAVVKWNERCYHRKNGSSGCRSHQRNIRYVGFCVVIVRMQRESFLHLLKWATNWHNKWKGALYLSAVTCGVCFGCCPLIRRKQFGVCSVYQCLWSVYTHSHCLCDRQQKCPTNFVLRWFDCTVEINYELGHYESTDTLERCERKAAEKWQCLLWPFSGIAAPTH